MTRRPRGDSLEVLAGEVIACRKCPRLVKYLAELRTMKLRRFAGQEYWARPLPGFGDPQARLIVVGLGPAAHGGARTGRVFTGDASSAFLYRALHKAGFASQPISISRDDGLLVRDAYITLGERCAPPENRPLQSELDNCRPYLVRELRLLGRLRVAVALGRIAWDQTVAAAREAFGLAEAPRPAFAHGAEVALGPLALIGSYHPSPQNTQTGRLDEAMFDRVFALARKRLLTSS